MSHSQPFKREKTLWIVIALLALVLLLVIFNQVQQNEQFRRFRRVAPPSLSSVSELIHVPLGSSESPDGRWNLQIDESGTPETMIEHRLILKGLRGQPDRILATQTETARKTNPFEPGTYRWHAAGWSKDGNNVYFVAEEVVTVRTDGIPVRTYGRELWEVNAQTATRKSKIVLPPGGSVLGQGFLDVSSVQNQALSITNGKITLSDLSGANKRTIKRTIGQQANDAWREFLLHPNGTHVAASFDRYAKGILELDVQPLETRVGVWNLQTNQFLDFGAINGSLLGWKNAKTLVVRNEQSGAVQELDMVLP